MLPEGKVVAENLTDLIEADQGLLTVFDEVYSVVTQSILDEIYGNGFENPDGLVELINTFDRYYREAKAAYLSSDGTAPPVWDKVFAHIGAGKPASRYARRVSVLEALALPIIVHMVHDLPLAVAEILTAHPEKGRVALRDYEQINSLLESGLRGVQNDVLKKYSPALILLSMVAGNADEVIVAHFIRLLRATTWYDAIRLFDTRQEIGEQMDILKAQAKAGVDKSDEVVQNGTRRLQKFLKAYDGTKVGIEARTDAYLDYLIKPPWFLLLFKPFFVALRMFDTVSLTIVALRNRRVEPPSGSAEAGVPKVAL